MSWLYVAVAVVSAVGAISAGNAADESAKYNAKILNQNAEVERAQSSVREDAQRRKSRQVLGAQRAAFAQAGTGSGGSALDVMNQSSRDAELDALTMRYEGDLRARGLKAQAEGEKYQGRMAKKASYFKATGSLIGGAAKGYE